MSHIALEINDAGLLLARGTAAAGEVVSENQGIALIEAAGVLTGEAARRLMRMRPLNVRNDFWRLLDTEPLLRDAAGRNLSAADLAYAQLSQIIEPVRAEATGLLLAVPPGYSRTQLGLLLGVANEAGVPLLGLADSALLAAALEPVPRRVLHLDLQLHQAVLSVLELDGGGLKRSRFEILPRQGWLALQQVWLSHIAAAFVRRTRFDPLHQAATEQTLADLLPAWLQRLSEEESITAEIEFGAATHAIELPRADLAAAAQPIYSELRRLVQAVRPAGEQVELKLTHRFMLLPGVLEQFGELRDCTVRVLRRGAASLGALAHAAAISRAPENIALVYRLPAVEQASVAAPEAAREVSTPPHMRPTHILFRDHAWQITETPLTLGWSVATGRRLSLPQSVPGLSRSHCSIRRRNGAVLIEDHSTYGSFINDERVNGQAVLAVGDRLRLGAPGVTLELIQLVNDDGTPQD